MLAECKRLDSINTPPITPKPGYEPKSRFLRSMYGLPEDTPSRISPTSTGAET